MLTQNLPGALASPAAWWKRAAAAAVDLLLIYLLTVLFITLACVFFQLPMPRPDAIKIADMVLPLTVFALAAWLYFALTESSAHQATPGKRLFRRRVTTPEGRRISFRQATIRFWVKGLCGFFPPAALAGPRPLHDVMAGTLVVQRGLAPATGPGREAARVGWRREAGPSRLGSLP